MANVDIILKAVDQASKEIGNVSKSLQGVDKAAGQAGKGASASLGQIVAVAGGVAGAVTAVGVAMKTAFDIGKQGAAVNQTAESFDNLIETIGAAPDTLDKLRAASRGTVDDMTLMSSTATLLAGTSGELALSLADATPQLLEIAKAAQKVNPSLGDTSFLYQSIATGIKRAQPDILDNLGLTIKIGEANEKYAKQLGKTVEELSANEKQQALLNATLEAGNILIAQAGGTTESATDVYEQFNTTLKNVSDEMKSDMAPAVGEVVKALNELLSAGQKVVDGFGSTEEAARKTADTYQDYLNEVVAYAESQAITIRIDEDKVTVLKRLANGMKDITDDVQLLTEEQWNEAKASESDAVWFKQLLGLIPMVGSSTREAADATDDLTNAQRNLATATINLRDAQQNWADGAGSDVQRALEESGVKGEAYDLALEGIDDTLGTSLATQNQYGKDLKAITDEYAKTGDVDKFNKKVGELKNTYMKTDESIKAATDSLWRFKLMYDTLKSKTITLDVVINGPPKPDGGGLGDGVVAPIDDTDPGGSQDGQRRAAGGPVSGYIINESAHTRPETVVMGNRNGQVLTKQQAQEALGRGGVNIYGAITVIANDPASFVRQLQAMGKQSRLASISGAQYQGG